MKLFYDTDISLESGDHIGHVFSACLSIVGVIVSHTHTVNKLKQTKQDVSQKVHFIRDETTLF